MKWRSRALGTERRPGVCPWVDAGQVWSKETWRVTTSPATSRRGHSAAPACGRTHSSTAVRSTSSWTATNPAARCNHAESSTDSCLLPGQEPAAAARSMPPPGSIPRQDAPSPHPAGTPRGCRDPRETIGVGHGQSYADGTRPSSPPTSTGPPEDHRRHHVRDPDGRCGTCPDHPETRARRRGPRSQVFRDVVERPPGLGRRRPADPSSPETVRSQPPASRHTSAGLPRAGGS